MNRQWTEDWVFAKWAYRRGIEPIEVQPLFQNDTPGGVIFWYEFTPELAEALDDWASNARSTATW